MTERDEIRKKLKNLYYEGHYQGQKLDKPISFETVDQVTDAILKVRRRYEVERVEKTIEIYANGIKELGLKRSFAFLSIHKDNLAKAIVEGANE